MGESICNAKRDYLLRDDTQLRNAQIIWVRDVDA